MASSSRSSSVLAIPLLLCLLAATTTTAARFGPADNHLLTCGVTAPAVLSDGQHFVPDSSCASTRLRSPATFSSLAAVATLEPWLGNIKWERRNGRTEREGRWGVEHVRWSVRYFFSLQTFGVKHFLYFLAMN
uniref:Uncharacterized protein n=1 Tax=Oryza barthii TaxID=65489 RepID=A0A0D3H3L4_9ORYZ